MFYQARKYVSTVIHSISGTRLTNRKIGAVINWLFHVNYFLITYGLPQNNYDDASW